MKKMEGLNILTKLDAEDREKIMYFANLLLKQKKYQKLREEIEEREKEIERGEIFTHEEIWEKIIN
jgi:predicted transcriptional regulator